ncbi:sporulation histidine kinase inhibitor Sda [Cytobacillus sp. NCCP-133]|nr:sporulation histidine kinase inhibitor Sda [Cytobacillus sp. NCCP-133]GLB60207.1 hypothetical protein NCCP133_23390 [Cytobacillus sp. NCCP-133]
MSNYYHLSTELLLEVYNEALKYHLDPALIDLLVNEIEKRGLGYSE